MIGDRSMSKYRVFEAGKRCKDHNVKGWETDTFDTKREAEIFAFHWAYPMPYKACVEFATNMDLNVEYDYSTSEFPVMMKIEEVKE